MAAGIVRAGRQNFGALRAPQHLTDGDVLPGYEMEKRPPAQASG